MGKITDFLIVIDMQNDFVYGSLANKDAQMIVPNVAEFIRNWEGRVMVTRDTHDRNYLDTQEGRMLPIPHCMKYSEGWTLVPEVYDAVEEKDDVITINKPTFGYQYWTNLEGAESITLIGVCTDICVVSNALIIKSKFPEVPVKVIADLCAGTTPENHKAALAVMASCQVEII